MQLTPPTVPDPDLVAAARSGNRAAFGTLVLRHRPLAWQLARRLLQDDGLADDAVQEAILQAWLNLDLLRRPERFGAWLAGIAFNQARRQLRSRGHGGLSWDDLAGGRLVREPVQSGPGPEEQAEIADLGLRVRAAVNGLPTAQRAAVLLVYLAGLRPAEAAATLHIAPGALRARLHKARATLREQLFTLWQEEFPMATTTDNDVTYIEVKVADVLHVPSKTAGAEGRGVVVLQSLDGARSLHIWIGGFERDSLALTLGSAPMQRPLTYRFTASLLSAAGATLREVRVSRLVDDTYFAEAILQTPSGEEQVVDARPSDAITLAATVGVPIKVVADVLARAEAFRAGYVRDDRSDVLHLPDILAGIKQRLDTQRSEFEAELTARTQQPDT